MDLFRITPPAEEPVTLSVVKLQCRVSYDFEDELFTDWIQGAREMLENELKRSFVDTVWRMDLDNFPPYPSRLGDRWSDYYLERVDLGSWGQIPFPKARVTSIASISYTDMSGSRQTLDPSLYKFQPGDFARVTPAYGHSWPTTRWQPGSVQITFTAGYGAASAVPACIRSAIRLLVAYQNENREAALIGVTGQELPIGIRRLIASENWGAGF